MKNTVFALGILLSCIQIEPLLAQNSVLAAGKWYKIGITQSGIHKLTATDLEKAGISLTGVNPQHLRLYGNGGGMLPQPNATPRPNDLTENAIVVAGEADGRWDATDYLLFYAQGPHVSQFNSTTRQFSHQTHLYSDTAYYFLTIAASPGKRVTQKASSSGATHEIQTFDDYIFHEKDQYNIVQSGREWWGEKLDVLTEQAFTFALPGMVATQPARISASVMAQSTANSQFLVQVNGQNTGTIPVGSIGTGIYDIKGEAANGTFSFTPSGTSVDVKLTHQRNNGVGYINWIGVQVKRLLKLYGDQTRFRSIESLDHSQVRYVVQEAGTDAVVWDVSVPGSPVAQGVTGSTSRIFEAEGGTLNEFVVFKPGAVLLSPAGIQPIANQNLHALPVPQLLLVTHPNFLTQAEELAAFRRTHDGLQVQVVTISQIYNEFSSGQQDVTALRDFIRFLYRKSAVLRYVLLMGDASYDYKNRFSGNTNFVPLYESYQSLHPIYSYSSDDYLGFLEEHEGAWNETSTGDHTLEVGIGRLPVHTPTEAKAMVAKLIRYAQAPETRGHWRQQVAFVADDGDGNTHQLDADRLAGIIQDNYKTYQTQKLFLDAFPQISFANGQYSPQLIETLERTVDKGCLILNYTGHGSELGWAQEKILTSTQIKDWRNTNAMPLLVTATCEFGRYDDPGQLSGGELAFLNPLGGAIGLLTTTRPVFSSSNYMVNVAFYNSVFAPVNGEMPRLGDIMRQTKNNSLSGSINRNFSLLGDPSMRLAYPANKIVLTRLNGMDLATRKDTLRAQSRVTLEGEVRDTNGVLLSNFNGNVQIAVLDKPRNASTLGTESARMYFLEQNTLLFKGVCTVRNGRFVAEWIMPKDIVYTLGEGVIRSYAQATQTRMDAAGAETVWIGGSNPLPIADTQSPEVRVFMNDTTFVSGGTTAPDPVFLARLKDFSGITLSNASIGHELTAMLDDTVTLVLNDAYLTLPDTYQQGEIRYPLKNLAPGLHHITLYVWDTYNNPSKAALNFTVVTEPFRLSNVRNHPNPAGTETVFAFTHNRAGEELEVTIEVWNALGKRVHVASERIAGSSDQNVAIPWNMTTSGILPDGIYFYQLQVRGQAETTRAAGKMVVRQ